MTIRNFALLFVLGLGLALCPMIRAAAQETDPPKPGSSAGRRDDAPPRPGASPRPRSGDERPEVPGDAPRNPRPGPDAGPAGGGRPGVGPGGLGGAPGRGPGERDPRGPGGLDGGPRGPGGFPGGPRPGGLPGGPPGGYGGPGIPGPGFGPPTDWEQMKRVDPEMYKLEMADQEMERQTSELSMQYRRAPKDQKPELRKELEEVVSKHFEVRQEKRQLQLTRLEKELQRMRDEIERRTQKRAEIVGKRLSELVGERSDIDF